MRVGRVWLGAALLLFASPAAAEPAKAGMVRFSIIDRLDPHEVEEITNVFVNGQPVGSLRLDARHPTARIDAAVPEAESYVFALCGQISVHTPDGATEMHRIDDGGTLADVEGRVFEALAADGFNRFFLADSADVTEPAAPTRPGACSALVS
ncbi:MAG TPA: hypothetical protein VMI52_00865 [Acetobacteraceae bacterium]|nr:hypothetical protein [Acetobacteraceae bacterium]